MIKSYFKVFYKREKTITGTLTFLLVLTVLVVSCSFLTVTYNILSKREFKELDDKAETLIQALDNIIEIPLWDFDYQNIKKIAEAYVHDEVFELLQIFDIRGELCFCFTRDRGYPVIEKSGKIIHEGEVIGNIKLAFSTKNLKKQNKQIIFNVMGVLFGIIVTLSFVTNLFFRKLLSKLFYNIDNIAVACANDTYDPQKFTVKYIEFYPLVAILQELSNKLKIKISEIEITEKKYRSIYENAVEGIFQLSSDGKFISVNPAFAKMLGYDSPGELLKNIQNINNKFFVHLEDREYFFNSLNKESDTFHYQTQVYRKNSSIAWIQFNWRPVINNEGKVVSIEGMSQDITLKKEAEEEHERLEQKLLHAQKMESVGRLAGGVAHDFNNMLSIIMGYSEILLESSSRENPDYDKIMEISKAARRSADLTRQLLTFARRQVISPKVMNINSIVSGMMKMLQRLLSEEILLSWFPGENVSMIKMDPFQIDQILANLCINARDAINGNGKIIIETSDVFLDEIYVNNHPDAEVGKYVMLSVSDNGSGMNETVIKNIFDPFFTTKGVGEGTGLGLATVYGIVKQNNGTIDVYSEEGKGSVFKIYFPAYNSGIIIEEEKEKTENLHGSETILLVEDEEGLLFLIKKILENLGYSVIATKKTTEAVELSKKSNTEIDLLITDVIMPVLNGKELAVKLREIFPDIKFLFMSGYSSKIIEKKEIMNREINFIQKPFSKAEIALKIREILDKEEYDVKSKY